MKKKEERHQPTSQPAGPRAWQLAQLAAMMVAETTVNIGSDGKETLSTHNRKVEHEWRLRDAEYLLLAAERASRNVHAYELFQDDSEFLGIDPARKRFASAGWPGLTSWASCENLLDEIIKSLRKHEQFLQQSQKTDYSRHYPAPEDARESAFWMSPDSLVTKSPKSSKKQYRVRTILLLAHLFCREEFKDRIEVPWERLRQKK